MRKVKVIIFVSLLTFGFIFLIYDRLSKDTYSDHVIREYQSTEIKSGKIRNDDWQPDFYFDGEKLLYDKCSGSYYYSLIEGSASAFDPQIRIEESGEVLNVAFDTLITSDLISSNGHIIACIYNDKYYCEKNLICTTLPLMNINSDGEIGDLDAWVDISLYDNSKTTKQREMLSEGYARVRGNITREFPKKSYKISLKQKATNGDISNKDLPFLGMRADDDWVLTACYNDQDKVRNMFSENLWSNSCGNDNEYNIQTGLELRYIELFINDQYWGLYTLGYKPDRKSMGSGIKSEDIYYKRDSLLTGFKSDTDVTPIYEYYAVLEENANNNEYLKSSIDVDNAIDFNLFVTLIQGLDNIQKNYYVLLVDIKNGKKAIYIPWDMDISWGDEWSANATNYMSYYTIRPDENPFFNENAIYQLLCNGDEEIWNLCFSKYEKLRENEWSNDTISKMLSEYEQQLFSSGAYIREENRWPDADISNERSLDTFKKYVFARLNEMDLLIERLRRERTNNPYINQSLLNNRFKQSTIIVEVNDKRVIKNEQIKTFLEYIGINLDNIAEDTRFVLTSFGGNDAEYISDFGDGGNAIVTEFGELELVDTSDGESEDDFSDDEYVVYFNNCKMYKNSVISGSDIVITSYHDGRATKMKLDEGYRVYVDMNILNNVIDADLHEKLVFSLLDNLDGYIILQINNVNNASFEKDVFLNQFTVDYSPYSSLEEVLESNENVLLLLDGEHRQGYLIENPYVPGTVYDTEIGQYAYFTSGTDYGIYINGIEVQTGNIDGIKEYELAVTIYSEDFGMKMGEYTY